MAAYGVTHGTALAPVQRRISGGLRRLVLALVWVVIASSRIVIAEPATADGLMLGAVLVLPLVGMAPLTPGLGLYLGMWMTIVAAGLIAATQAGAATVPMSHMGITFYLSLSSLVIAGFVAGRPAKNVRLIMSAYVFAALVAAIVAIIGYFSLLPGAEIFTEYGRARGTFKDPNVLGAFLVPAVLYAFNAMVTVRGRKAWGWAAAMPSRRLRMM
jgi:hypothetical protein